MSFSLTLETRRLSLRPAGEAWLATMLAGAGSFSLVTGLDVAHGCCDPDAIRWALAGIRIARNWELRWWAPLLFVEKASRTVIGMGGFKGPPRQHTVELGYHIAPSHRRRGLATEAATALATEALKQPGIDRVVAHTLPAPGPSPRVLKKAGFTQTREVAHSESGVAWRWEFSRPRIQPELTAAELAQS